MGKVIRAIALGAALSVATTGCASEKTPLEKVEGLDLSNLPTPEVAIAKRLKAEQTMGKACVNAITQRNEKDLSDAVNEILTLPSHPCGEQREEVNHDVEVKRAHDAEVAFAIDKANE